MILCNLLIASSQTGINDALATAWWLTCYLCSLLWKAKCDQVLKPSSLETRLSGDVFDSGSFSWCCKSEMLIWSGLWGGSRVSTRVFPFSSKVRAILYVRSCTELSRAFCSSLWSSRCSCCKSLVRHCLRHSLERALHVQSMFNYPQFWMVECSFN